MTNLRKLPTAAALAAIGATTALFWNGAAPAQGIVRPSSGAAQQDPQPQPPPETLQPPTEPQPQPDPNAPPVPAPPTDPNAPAPPADPNAPAAPAEPPAPPAPDQPNDLLTAASRDSRIATLVKAIKAAGLDTLLGDKEGGPYTVFGPVNTAFTRLPQGTLENLLKPENKEQLITLLKNHVVNGRLTRADLLKMKEGDELTTLAGTKLKIGPLVRRTPTIGGASIVSADALASNGVLHLINAVLVPAPGPPSVNPPGGNPPPNNDTPHPAPAP